MEEREGFGEGDKRSEVVDEPERNRVVRDEEDDDWAGGEVILILQLRMSSMKGSWL